MKTKNHKLKRALVLGVAAAILGSGINMTDVHAKAVTDTFDLQAHRGGRDLRPEDTLPAFANALEMGVTTLELDMQLTGDGRLVISHNPKLESIVAKDPSGAWVKKGQHPDMRNMTLAEIKLYDVGSLNPNEKEYYNDHAPTQKAIPGTHVPTLEDVFELANAYGNDKVLFNIETKSYAPESDPDYLNKISPEQFAKAVLAVVKKYNMEDRVTIQTFDWRTIQEVRRLDKNITTVALTSQNYRSEGKPGCSPWMGGLDIDDFNGNYVQAAHAINADIISPRFNDVTPEFVAESHRLGMKIVPWTINKKDVMIKLIDMGVDGIITDRPDILRETLIEKGIPVADPTPRPANLAKKFPESRNW